MKELMIDCYDLLFGLRLFKDVPKNIHGYNRVNVDSTTKFKPIFEEVRGVILRNMPNLPDDVAEEIRTLDFVVIENALGGAFIGHLPGSQGGKYLCFPMPAIDQMNDGQRIFAIGHEVGHILLSQHMMKDYSVHKEDELPAEVRRETELRADLIGNLVVRWLKKRFSPEELGICLSIFKSSAEGMINVLSAMPRSFKKQSLQAYYPPVFLREDLFVRTRLLADQQILQLAFLSNKVTVEFLQTGIEQIPVKSEGVDKKNGLGDDHDQAEKAGAAPDASAQSLAEMLMPPRYYGEDKALTARVRSILQKNSVEILNFMGVSDIQALRYEVDNEEDTDGGYVIRCIVISEHGEESFFVKLRHSEKFTLVDEMESNGEIKIQERDPRGDWIKFHFLDKGAIHGLQQIQYRKNPTALEYELTLAASKAGAFPPSMVVNDGTEDAIIIKGIDDGVSLMNLEHYPVLLALFLENEKFFIKEIGRQYGRLNKKANVLQYEIKLSHIFITLNKKVLLIDLSTRGDEGPMAGVWKDGPFGRDWDIARLKAELRVFADKIVKVAPRNTGVSSRNDLYSTWVSEGYDEISDSGQTTSTEDEFENLSRTPLRVQRDGKLDDMVVATTLSSHGGPLALPLDVYDLLAIKDAIVRSLLGKPKQLYEDSIRKDETVLDVQGLGDHILLFKEYVDSLVPLVLQLPRMAQRISDAYYDPGDVEDQLAAFRKFNTDIPENNVIELKSIMSGRVRENVGKIVECGKKIIISIRQYVLSKEKGAYSQEHLTSWRKILKIARKWQPYFEDMALFLSDDLKSDLPKSLKRVKDLNRWFSRQAWGSKGKKYKIEFHPSQAAQPVSWPVSIIHLAIERLVSNGYHAIEADADRLPDDLKKVDLSLDKMDGGRVKLTLENPGRIPEALLTHDTDTGLPQLFLLDPYRLDAGHGIGLPFAVRVIQKLGGTITVTNIVKGSQPYTRFEISLPADMAENHGSNQSGVTGSVSDASGGLEKVEENGLNFKEMYLNGEKVTRQILGRKVREMANGLVNFHATIEDDILRLGVAPSIIEGETNPHSNIMSPPEGESTITGWIGYYESHLKIMILYKRALAPKDRAAYFDQLVKMARFFVGYGLSKDVALDSATRQVLNELFSRIVNARVMPETIGELAAFPLSTESRDKAEKLGGIDLDPAKINLSTKNSGGEIAFDLDPAMLARLQSASGIAPVIISVRPLESLSGFLGIVKPDGPGR